MSEERSCENSSCAVQFVPPPSAPHKRWCSETCCHQDRNRRRVTSTPPEATCEICGDRFSPDRFHPTSHKCCLRSECRRIRNQLLHNAWRQRRHQREQAREVTLAAVPPTDLHTVPNRVRQGTNDAPGAADSGRMPAQPLRGAGPSISAPSPPPRQGQEGTVRERFCANPSCLERFVPPPSAPGKQWCSDRCRQQDRSRRRRVTYPPDEIACEICGASFRPNQFHSSSQKCCWRPACRRIRNQLLHNRWRQGRRASTEKRADVGAG